MKLPESFLKRMKELLGEEYEAWLESYGLSATQGIRINPAKISKERWNQLCPWKTEKVLWNPNGYYCDSDIHPAKDVYYYAGLYYIQEPTAMAPSAILDVRPGQKVLDLCAAPGGKSTDLGAQLEGRGLLIANDISASRAKALLKNLELAGISNACVTAEEPEKLAEVFGEFFDKILVDAPCSGEGMFRKEPDLIKSWEERRPEYYVPLQRKILKEAVGMLKPGGELVYSTCTFSEEEDEAELDWILREMPEMEQLPLKPWEGAAGGIDGKPAIRLYPHRIKGEGHFVALLRKKGKREERGQDRKRNPEIACLEKERDYCEWEQLLTVLPDRKRMTVRDGRIYVLPEGFCPEWKLRFLRTGLLVGSVKKGKFEPSQAMAMALKKEMFSRTFSMSREDDRVIRYLKGESIFLSEEEYLSKGWVLVCVDDFPLGWAKSTGTGLKNKYCPGWRWQ